MSKKVFLEIYNSEIDEIRERFPLEKPPEYPTFTIHLDEMDMETRSSFEFNKNRVMIYQELHLQRWFDQEVDKKTETT